MAQPNQSLTVFYDGACPICIRKMAFIRRHDKAQKIHYEDVSTPVFEPTKFGLERSAMLKSIHVRLNNGTILRGMDAFRAIYQEIGLGFLLNWTRLPLIRPLADLMYAILARLRPRRTLRNCPHRSCG